MTENEARQAITKWAKGHFAENDEHVIPAVSIVSIRHDAEDDTWEAELEVSTSADNPHVTFFKSDQHGYGLQIASIEY